MLARMEVVWKEPLYNVSGNVSENQYGGSSKKLKIALPCDPAISLPGYYLKKCKSTYNRDTCTLMFIAALFTIAKW
jgi:hypothetical protein